MGASEARTGSELLARHSPLLRYDSAERWLASSVQSWRAGPVAAVPVDETSPVYGHLSHGSDGRIWLAYWLFYLYNDPRLVGSWLPAGTHEGDWEMIQLRLDPSGDRPDLALYAQHAHVAARVWPEVERSGSRPVIYVGRGSHACYFRPGWHWTGVWFERSDGRQGPIRPQLMEIRDGDPRSSWAFWPGRWGATLPRGGLTGRLGLTAASPRGPGHQRQWKDPAVLLAEARSER